MIFILLSKCNLEKDDIEYSWKITQKTFLSLKKGTVKAGKRCISTFCCRYFPSNLQKCEKKTLTAEVKIFPILKLVKVLPNFSMECAWILHKERCRF